MQDHVAVGVGKHATIVRHADAAEHHVITLAEGMDVESLADAHVWVLSRLGNGEWGMGMRESG
ncbi:hypothetical protein GCM10027359_12070 [Marilutibacter aestuarii]